MTSGAERVEHLDARTFWERRGEFEGCELVDGRVHRVSPTGYRHGRVEARVVRLLDEYCEGAGQGEVVAGEVGYQLGEGQVRAADVAVHLRPRAEGQGWVTQMPDLAVEVVSPSDHWTDVERKARDYLEAGVREMWIVDPSEQRVVVRAPDGTQHSYGTADCLGSAVLHGLSLTVRRLFG